MTLAALRAEVEHERAIQTLRDTFAMAALQGLLTTMEYTTSEEFLAKKAYQIADKMLIQRSRDAR